MWKNEWKSAADQLQEARFNEENLRNVVAPKYERRYYVGNVGSGLAVLPNPAPFYSI